MKRLTSEDYMVEPPIRPVKIKLLADEPIPYEPIQAKTSLPTLIGIDYFNGPDRTVTARFDFIDWEWKIVSKKPIK